MDSLPFKRAHFIQPVLPNPPASLPTTPPTVSPIKIFSIITEANFKKYFVIVFFPTLCSMFVLLGLLYGLRRLGSWKVVRPGPRPRYLRTWHGWIKKEKHDKWVDRRKRFKTLLDEKLNWNSRSFRYDWVFWDPRGAKRHAYMEMRQKSYVHRLKRWVKNLVKKWRQHRQSKKVPDRLGAVEEGKASFGLSRKGTEAKDPDFSLEQYHAWLKSIHAKNSSVPSLASTNSARMLGALPSSRDARHLGTLRNPRKLRIRRPGWNKRSQEEHRQKYFSKKFLSSSNRVACKALTLPRATLRKAYHSRPRVHSLPPLPKPPFHSHKRRKIDQTSDPNSPRPFLSFKPGVAYNHNTILPERVPSLNRTGKEWEKPVVLDPFTSVGDEYSGTAGRPASPANGWVVEEEPKIPYFFEGSVRAKEVVLDDPVSFESSSRSSRDYLWMHMSPNRDSQGSQLNIPQQEQSSPDWFFGNSARRAASEPFAKEKTSSISSPTPRHGESHGFVQTSPSISKQGIQASTGSLPRHISKLPRARLPPATKVPRTTIRKPPKRPQPTKATEYLSVPAAAFLGELDRRLDVLAFQLSPGFHFGGGFGGGGLQDPGFLSIASRASRTPVRNSSFKNPLNPRPHPWPVGVSRRSFPTLNSAIFNSAAFRGQGFLSEASAAEIRYGREQPEEWKIDTAAYLFRREPIGEPRPNAAEKRMLYTDGRKKARTLRQWQIPEQPTMFRQSLRSLVEIVKGFWGWVVGREEGVGVLRFADGVWVVEGGRGEGGDWVEDGEGGENGDGGEKGEKGDGEEKGDGGEGFG